MGKHHKIYTISPESPSKNAFFSRILQKNRQKDTPFLHCFSGEIPFSIKASILYIGYAQYNYSFLHLRLHETMKKCLKYAVKSSFFSILAT